MWKKEFNLFVMLSCAFGLAWALTGEASAVEAMRVSAFGVSNFTLVSSDGLGGAVQLKADSFLPWVDGFGQGNFTDWRGKVHSVDDLKAAAMRETAELSSSSPGIPQADRFGG